MSTASAKQQVSGTPTSNGVEASSEGHFDCSFADYGHCQLIDCNAGILSRNSCSAALTDVTRIIAVLSHVSLQFYHTWLCHRNISSGHSKLNTFCVLQARRGARVDTVSSVDANPCSVRRHLLYFSISELWHCVLQHARLLHLLPTQLARG